MDVATVRFNHKYDTILVYLPRPSTKDSGPRGRMHSYALTTKRTTRAHHLLQIR